MFDEILKQHFDLDKIQIKDKIIQGGGGYSMVNYINLLIGIVMIIIGMMCMFYEKFWNTIDAQILKIKENDMLIGYEINNIYFTKLINTYVNNYKEGDKIKIYYDKSDPNIVKTNMFNHKIIGTIIITIGMYLILSQYLC